MSYVSMKEMLEAGVHFGHQSSRWNPKMRPYIYGVRNGIHIIDLSRTVRLFDKAAEFVAAQVAQGRHVLYVGTKKQGQEVIAEEAVRGKQFYIVNRWLGGTLTNYRTIKSSIDRLKELDRMAADGSMEKFTKKEALMLTRQRTKLEKNLGGIKDMPGVPGALIVFDPRKEAIAVREANKLGIPVVAVTDTNCDPEGVSYIIPGNDDAIRAIRLFAAGLADAALEGGRRSGANRPADKLTTAFVGEGGEDVTAEQGQTEVIRKPGN